MFTKSFVINLPFKTDRLEVFTKSYPSSLPAVEVWPAVHGDSIRHPDWWTSGAGAWGCYRSHLQILERCYQDNVESYIVFEDDAIFRDDFTQQLTQFLNDLPVDWEMLYLGGQLLHENDHPPLRVTDNVFVPYNVNRTHCFAVHRRGYEKVYKHLFGQMQPGEHIDHHLGRLHESGNLKVYCPGKWLVGQDGGPSNISGNTNAATFWIDPEKLAANHRYQHADQSIPAVWLECSIEVARDLERRGWHRGKWQDHAGYDRGVINALQSSDIKGGLHGWYKYVMPEAVREGLKCVALHSPGITQQIVETLDFAEFHRIKASSSADAERQLADIVGRLTAVPSQPYKRNLIYHIWPRKGNGVWQWNVEQLLKRIEQFNGVRSIGVVLGENTDTLEDMQAAFAGHRIDNWIVGMNDPSLGEMVSFPKLLDTVQHVDGITFYGHAKGAKYDHNQNVQDWASVMYDVCLDDREYVNASLEQCPVTGPFKNNREYKGEMRFGWHYSGTFFWFKNDDLFKRDWKQFDLTYYGSEKYLGNLFEEREAGDLFGGHIGWLYHANEMNRVRSMLVDWKAKTKKNRLPIKTIPVYINARNLLTPLKKLVEYLIQIPNARPIIIDNDSTWQPLLDYYDVDCPCEVIRTGVNGGKFGWAKQMLDHTALGIEKYVVTDADMGLEGVPTDVLDVLSDGLDGNPSVNKCGLSLDFEGIPADHPQKQAIIDWECQFWRNRTNGWCHAGIDTTFSMRRATDPIAYETGGHLRRDRPYCAKHYPWQLTADQMATDPEYRHYIETANSDGLHWTALTQSEELRPVVYV